MHSNSPICNMLISVGVNDVAVNSRPKNVYRRLMTLVRVLKQKHPKIKLVLSEVTPRNDTRDSVVTSTNKLLRKTLETQEDVVLVYHDNLRRAEFFSDGNDVLFSQEGAMLFADNLKTGLSKLKTEENVFFTFETQSDHTNPTDVCYDDSDSMRASSSLDVDSFRSTSSLDVISIRSTSSLDVLDECDGVEGGDEKRSVESKFSSSTFLFSTSNPI